METKNKIKKKPKLKFKHSILKIIIGRPSFDGGKKNTFVRRNPTELRLGVQSHPRIQSAFTGIHQFRKEEEINLVELLWGKNYLSC